MQVSAPVADTVRIVRTVWIKQRMYRLVMYKIVMYRLVMYILVIM